MTYGEDVYKTAKEKKKKIQQNFLEDIRELVDPKGSFFNDIKKEIEDESKKGNYNYNFGYHRWVRDNTNNKRLEYMLPCKMIANIIAKELDISAKCNFTHDCEGGAYVNLYMDWNKKKTNNAEL